MTLFTSDRTVKPKKKNLQYKTIYWFFQEMDFRYVPKNYFFRKKAAQVKTQT